jgi:hypothetical protein
MALRDLIKKTNKIDDNIEGELKSYKFLTWIILICFIGFFLFVIYRDNYSLHINNSLASPVFDNNSKWTFNETYIVDKIFWDLDGRYWGLAKSVLITKNSSILPRGYGGINKNGNIIILFLEDSEMMKKNICHELLHSLITSRVGSHTFVYNLGNKEVCYGDSSKI